MRRRTKRISKNLIAGAAGGLAASFVMNQFQTLWTTAEKKLSKSNGNQQGGGEDATVKTAEAISKNTRDRGLTRSEKKWAGPAVHYAFGSLVGAVYGVLAETVPPVAVARGIAYGSAVWLAADVIGVPAFGLGKPATRTSPGEHVKALASHVVYGLATDLTRRTLQRVTA